MALWTTGSVKAERLRLGFVSSTGKLYVPLQFAVRVMCSSFPLVFRRIRRLAPGRYKCPLPISNGSSEDI